MDVEVTGTIGGQNEVIAERFIYAPDRFRTVLLGSSLTARLPRTALGAKTYNLALASENPATGLQIVLRSGALPARLLVESNVINGEVDRAFVDGLFSEPQHGLRALFPTLREQYRPTNVFIALLRGSNERNRERLLAQRADPGIQARMTKTFEDEYNQSIRADLLLGRLRDLKAQFDVLRARGVQVMLFEMPISPVLQQTNRMKALREQTTAVFPQDQYPRIDLSTGSPIETEDGLHLVYRDAERVARLLHDAVETQCRNGNTC